MEIYNTISEGFWEEVVSESDHATFFHTNTWAKIVTSSLPGYTIKTKGFVLEDGTRAVLPLLVSRSKLTFFFRTYHSMAPGVYGGIISNGRRLTNEEINEIFKSFMGYKCYNLAYVSNPFCDYEIPGAYFKDKLFTQMINLKQGFDCIKRNYSRGNKSNLNKATKRGVQIFIAESLEDYKNYYKIYEDSLKRWGNKKSSEYSFKMFRNIHSLKSSKIKLWLAKVEGKIIAGALICYHNNHAVSWHGAALQDYFDFRANNILYNEIIRDATEKGFSYFDFNPSSGHDGVVRFKESFGSEKINFSFCKWSSNALYKIYLKHRN